MSSECHRIADQLSRAFSGDPWHGPPLSELLAGMSHEQALSRPLSSAHNIWELVAHIDLYVKAALDAAGGTPMPKWYDTGRDWPAISDRTPDAWSKTVDSLFRNAASLAHFIESLSDTKLNTTVPGREYDFYYLLHGIVQHSLYHGGQIALIRKSFV